MVYSRSGGGKGKALPINADHQSKMFTRSGLNKVALHVLSAATLGGLVLIGWETSQGKRIGEDFEKSKDDFTLFKRTTARSVEESVPPPEAGGK